MLNYELEEIGENNAKTPEYQLVAAILHRAILDLLSDDRNIYKSAASYFKPFRDRSSYPFSYKNCCSLLNIDHKMLSGMISDLRYHLRRKRKHPSMVETSPFHERLQLHSKPQRRTRSI